MAYFNGKRILNSTVVLVENEKKLPPTDSRYFDITPDGITSLKPQYRGTVPSSADDTKYQYAISDNGKGKVGSQNNELPDNIVIPDEVNGIAVKSLPLGMFFYNNAVKSVTIPKSITEIPEAFARGAVNLHTVNGTENVKILGQFAFYLSSIENANFPNLETCGKTVFRECFNLVYANIGNKLTAIPERMFFQCGKLTDLYGGEKVTSVGAEAFYHNRKLKKPVFLPNLKSIGDNAFRWCRINFDWASLTGCTFGSNATPFQYNPTDFWSSCTPTPCETPLWSVFSQDDPKWGNDPVCNYAENGTLLTWEKNGCVPTSAAIIYSKFEKKYLYSPKEFVDAVKLSDESLMNMSCRQFATMKQWLEAVGYTAPYYSPLSGNLQRLYDALATGALVIIEVDNDLAGFDGGHVVVLYGVNEHGEVLVQDPSSLRGANLGSVPELYSIPIQNISASTAAFMVVTKG